ncbi:hypothetical protein M3661_16840 [Paenibacillus sp. MER 180]|uniref:hypothetical protein n=1 Tax=Paenibacillus sp. MER 180 TaxID=2939570 RepID=UPI00203F075A|nr:hypothetical protein [Paenibacillus sp. MER 180]MCM3291799.1 hypothetical protein [Paenibacillus sp. MER 180]
MTSKRLEAFMKLRVQELQDKLYKDNKEFHTQLTISYQEFDHINKDVGSCMLEIEEKLNELLDFVEIVYKTAFKDGFEWEHLEHSQLCK